MGLSDFSEHEQKNIENAGRSFDAMAAGKIDDKSKLGLRSRSVLIFIAVLLFSLQAFTSAKNEKKSSQPIVKSSRSIPSQTEAQTYALRFIRDHLECPSSARFADQSNGLVVSVLETGPLYFQFEIKGWVASENSFGIVIQRDFRCVVSKRGDSEVWKLEQLDLHAVPENWRACKISRIGFQTFIWNDFVSGRSSSANTEDLLDRRPASTPLLVPGQNGSALSE